MNNFKYLITGFILIFSIGMSYGQKYEFGKVSKDELLEKSYPLDSSANAAVLYENKKVWYEYSKTRGFQLVTEVYQRIKLYNKNGFEHATHEILLYRNSSNKEKISGLKGVSYSLVDNKINETKLDKDEVFENEYSENYNEVKFTMPSLSVGSIVEFKYKIISPFIYSIDKIYLQQSIPIKKLEISVNIPEYYNFKKYTTGYLPINLKESSRNKIFSVNSKSKKYGALVTQYSVNQVDYEVNMNSIVSTNVPAFIEEPYSGNPENYLSSILFELQFTRFGNSIENYATTWEAVAKSVFENPRFGNELERTTYFKNDIDQLLGTTSHPIKKALLIYSFVQEKMNWNNKYGVVTRDGVKKAYTDGVGNSAEINLMLIGMLKYAGVEVNPVLVSSIRKTISLFPTLEGFDYVIARVKSGDEILFLDATDKYGEPNILPGRVVHGSGRIISEKGTSQLIDFRPEQPATGRFSLQCKLSEDGVITGKTNLYHKDYLAHSFRTAHAIKDKETQTKRLKKRYEITDLNNYELKSVDKLGEPVVERFEFTVDDQAEVIEDEIYFAPLLFLRDKENIFKSNERLYPVDFGYGYANQMMVSIQIPEGYEVSEIPKSQAFKLPGDMGSFVYRSNVNADKVQMTISENLKTPFIPAEYYPTLKQFYNQIIQKENDQVVLKKI